MIITKRTLHNCITCPAIIFLQIEISSVLTEHKQNTKSKQKNLPPPLKKNRIGHVCAIEVLSVTLVYLTKYYIKVKNQEKFEKRIKSKGLAYKIHKITILSNH